MEGGEVLRERKRTEKTGGRRSLAFGRTEERTDWVNLGAGAECG